MAAAEILIPEGRRRYPDDIDEEKAAGFVLREKNLRALHKNICVWVGGTHEVFGR